MTTTPEPISHDRWQVVYCILTTPFRRDLSLDLDGYRRNARHAIERGVDILVSMGTQGDFYALDLRGAVGTRRDGRSSRGPGADLSRHREQRRTRHRGAVQTRRRAPHRCSYAPAADARAADRISVVKIFLDEMGLAGGPVRLPLAAITDEARDQVRIAAVQAGIR